MSHRKLLSRLAAARRFPNNTCPASRHSELIGRQMLKSADTEHDGESILNTVCALYEARNQLASQRL